MRHELPHFYFTNANPKINKVILMPQTTTNKNRVSVQKLDVFQVYFKPRYCGRNFSEKLEFASRQGILKN
jgi:hypothetical protein